MKCLALCVCVFFFRQNDYGLDAEQIPSGLLRVTTCRPISLLCRQEEELDCQQGVIDFSLYLRASPTEDGEPAGGNHDMSESKYERVLDQKNYIEELNRHLKWVHTDRGRRGLSGVSAGSQRGLQLEVVVLRQGFHEWSSDRYGTSHCLFCVCDKNGVCCHGKH